MVGYEGNMDFWNKKHEVDFQCYCTLCINTIQNTKRSTYVRNFLSPSKLTIVLKFQNKRSSLFKAV